jgi:hypothetical protein
MGVVVGVDEARQDEVPAPVEFFDRSARDRSKARRDAGDRVAGDGDVGCSRCVPVAAGSIGRPPRMISVVPGRIGRSDMGW